MKKTLVIYIILHLSFFVAGQNLSNLRVKLLKLSSDTVKLDSLSIINGTEKLFFGSNLLSDSIYQLDYSSSVLIINSAKYPDIKIFYRVFDINFSKTYKNKEIDSFFITNEKKRFYKADNIEIEKNIFFNNSDIQKSGSISRGITFGNNQDASVNSDLNLILSGKISENISINAAISDNNIPLQAEGSTQQIREFDKVFIELSSKKANLTVGDFNIQHNENQYLKLNKKLQGLNFKTAYSLNNSDDIKIENSVSAAVSKGKYNKMYVIAEEGVQGPYKLSGKNSELYIMILSGSERIYIDGKLMKRGFDRDYVIDYNTGELTFTINQIITKDSRIIAEFEYSDKNYARFLFSANNKINFKKGVFFINIFSEHDAKNQILQQNLTDFEKNTLINAGDNPENALVPNIAYIDTFTNSEILYRRTDTIVNGSVYNDIYVYSTNPDDAEYRLGFRYKGQGQGNYILIKSEANGKVYKWTAPENGILQGDYETTKQLVSPQKMQILNFGGNIKLKKGTKIGLEAALSNFDKNTFSPKSSEDNKSYAFNFDINQQLIKDTTDKLIVLFAKNSYIDKNFISPEPYKTAEYSRDWNLGSENIVSNENLSEAGFIFKKKDFGKLKYSFLTLIRENIYTAYKNELSVNILKKKISANFNVNRLKTKDTIQNTDYLRYLVNAEYKAKKFVFGVSDEGERNIFSLKSDNSLKPESFRFNIYKIYLKNPEGSTNKYFLQYENREDFLADSSELSFSTHSHEIKSGFGFLKNKTNKLTLQANYRNLKYAGFDNDKLNESGFSGKINNSLRLFKGSVNLISYAENNIENERKKEYSYVEVQEGQGYYAWKDFNKNDIKELNEFVKANFSDEANYIKIIFPTVEYQKVYSQTFNQSVNVFPKRIWYSKKGIKKIANHFSDKFYYRLNRKIFGNENYYKFFVNDTNIMTHNTSLKNILSFNFPKSSTSADYILKYDKIKNLTTNGSDKQNHSFNMLILRQKFFSSFILSNEFSSGTKDYISDFFIDNNYKINYSTNKVIFSYNFENSKNVNISFKYVDKKEIREKQDLKAYDLGVQMNFRAKNGLAIITDLHYVKNNFSGEPDSFSSYEMLQGLKNGNNFVWELSLIKKISKYLQIQMNYTGRKSPKIKAIHTGNFKITAIF